ncbi:MAG: hypothetical protein H0X17_06550 [Deltaproteobacteria bacterium]|nr:hypothetical protein [Deltaproteobacteria bacterium]
MMALLPLVVGGALALRPGPAAADAEQAVSAGLGYATFSAVGEVAMEGMEPPAVSPDGGGAISVAYERMIGSDVGLRGELAGGVFRGGNTAKQTPTSYALLADAGVVFRFDVLNVVPYAFGGLGTVTTGGGPIDSGTHFVLVVGGGADWLRSRSRSYGLEVRLASFGGDVTVVTVGFRATHRWGFF